MPSNDWRELLLEYIEGRLDAETSEQLEAQLERDSDLQADYFWLREMQDASHDWRDEPVPAWSRARHVVRPSTTVSSPLGLWLSGAALAMSCFLMLAVGLNISVLQTEQGILITRTDQVNQRLIQSEVEQQVAAQVAALVEQQVALQMQDVKYQQRLQQQQQTRNLAAVVNQVRLERRSDLGQLADQWMKVQALDRQRVDALSNYQANNRKTLQQLQTQVSIQH